MHLIVGLGNPGHEYENHRHNVGFMAVDAIARAHHFPPYRAKFHGLIADHTIDGERVLVLKPSTFMNRSGDSVGAVAQFYKLGPGDMTVIHDELDLAPGKIRVKTGGGNGGHNGLRSIDPVIGANYARLRIGIGHPGHREGVTHHVLGNFSKADYAWLDPLLQAIADNAVLLARTDAAGFMNKVALATASAPDPAPKRQSHIRQARSDAKPDVPNSGPMADMLKRLFRKD